MRLIHTSDWHLGRSFHREDLLGAQADFLDTLVAAVRSERADAVIVAGDLYDRALPPVDAVRLCNDALARLAALRVRTVVVSGNHDSAARLGFASGLIDAAGVHLRTDPAGVGTPVMLHDEHGPVAVYAVPYLEPETAAGPLGCAARSHHGVLTAAASAARADLAVRPAGTRSVLVAHAFVAGGQPSDSERDISVGGVSAVGLPTVGGFSYVALGHLHGAQALAPTIRYSGSPLAYSFSEEHQRKGMWLVELDERGVGGVHRLPVPVPRRVARVSGRLDELLTGERYADLERAWLQVTLTDPVRPRSAMDRLRLRFPHTLVLGYAPDGEAQRHRSPYSTRVGGLGDLDVALRFVEDVRSCPDDAEVRLLREAFEWSARSEAAV